MVSRHYGNKARRAFWVVHLEAWRQSGLSMARYCGDHRLNVRTFTRWLEQVVGEETARKHVEYQTQRRREERRELKERERRARVPFSSDRRSRAVQAFWAMHVEALIWSGMGVREYAAALQLSPASLRKWRDRLIDGEMEIDWRAHLHPSARPVVGTSASGTAPGKGLTRAETPAEAPVERTTAQPSRRPLRRFFSDAEKRAIALESDRPGVSVSSVARKHGIVTGLLFRWRVQFGIAQKERAMLAPVVLPDGVPVMQVLQDLLRAPDAAAPDAAAAVAPPDGRRATGARDAPGPAPDDDGARP